MQDPRETLSELGESDDRRAVSPVIGVILMVAITVILAAVIATFVLGLGEQVSDTTPNANFQADFEPDNSSDFFVTIQHQSGDPIEVGELRIGGDLSLNGTADSDLQSAVGDELTAGDSFTIGNSSSSADIGVENNSSVSEGDEIQLVYDTGDSGSILRTFEIPRDYSVRSP